MRPNKWENSVLKRKEHNVYHQTKEGPNTGIGRFQPTPGRNAMLASLYTPPKKIQIAINGIKNRSITFIDCREILASS